MELVVEPQGVGRYSAGKRRADQLHQVSATALLSQVQHPAHGPSGPRLGLDRPLRREGAEKQSPHPGVQRRVDLAEEALVVGNDDSCRAEPLGGGEPLGVTEGGLDLGMPGDEDEPFRRSGDRRLGPHAPHQVPHVLGLGWVERVEGVGVVGLLAHGGSPGRRRGGVQEPMSSANSGVCIVRPPSTLTT